MDFGIDHRCADAKVTEQLLDGRDPAASIEKLRRAGVPQSMGSYFDPCSFPRGGSDSRRAGA